MYKGIFLYLDLKNERLLEMRFSNGKLPTFLVIDTNIQSIFQKDMNLHS